MTNVIDIAFLERFASAFYVNIVVACASLLIGVAVGLPFAYARRLSGVLGRMVGFTSALLRAAPIFVLMFLILNIWDNASAEEAWWRIDAPYAALVLALSAYSISVISDVYFDMLTQLRAGDKQAAMLLVPNLFRVFTILVMATSVGAAIGVNEAITVTLDKMESLPARSEKIWLILFVLLCFILFFSTAKYLVARLVSLIKKKGR